MTIYLVTNSTALPDPGGLSTRIGAKVLNNDTCVTQALYTLQKIKIKLRPNDFIIFNEGVNDCIYRKDKTIQSWQIGYIYGVAEKEGDTKTMELMKEKQAYLSKKLDQELFQFLTFEEFEKYVDECFKLFPNQGIVLSVQKVDPASKKFGWAYNEIIKTNEILERKAKEYGLTYVDLFNVDIEHYDDIHFTGKGLDTLTKIVQEELDRKNIKVEIQELQKRKRK